MLQLMIEKFMSASSGADSPQHHRIVAPVHESEKGCSADLPRRIRWTEYQDYPP